MFTIRSGENFHQQKEEKEFQAFIVNRSFQVLFLFPRLLLFCEFLVLYCPFNIDVSSLVFSALVTYLFVVNINFSHDFGYLLLC